ncbi:hypothetical protein [Candidatus Leptofilum sp.]|uniref:hypothetical protein n=1 Tax=Candidatus Leptofilum sp. TaxID=3241576 RepID=UPI003B5CA5C4
MKKQHLYHAYLLRCWQENDAKSDTPSWRFSLEGVRDKQRRGFADLDTLLEFLQQITQKELNHVNSSN